MSICVPHQFCVLPISRINANFLQTSYSVKASRNLILITFGCISPYMERCWIIFQLFFITRSRHLLDAHFIKPTLPHVSADKALVYIAKLLAISCGIYFIHDFDIFTIKLRWNILGRSVLHISEHFSQ